MQLLSGNALEQGDHRGREGKSVKEQRRGQATSAAPAKAVADSTMMAEAGMLLELSTGPYSPVLVSHYCGPFLERVLHGPGHVLGLVSRVFWWHSSRSFVPEGGPGWQHSICCLPPCPVHWQSTTRELSHLILRCPET